MSMDINVTFFVQATHFLVAYLILEKLLFRPSLHIIENEQKQYNNLINAINTQQALLKDKEVRKQQEWDMIRASLAQLIPEIKPPAYEIHTYKLNPPPIINQHEQETYQQTLQNYLVKRLSHVS